MTTPFERADRAELLRERHLNLQAPIRLTHALFPTLQRAQGQVISVVSLGSMIPLGQSAGYSGEVRGCTDSCWR